MKKSLLIINIFLGMSMMQACHKSAQHRTPSDAELKTMQLDTLKKDSARAIIHRAPDQERIDSIKRSKKK